MAGGLLYRLSTVQDAIEFTSVDLRDTKQSEGLIKLIQSSKLGSFVDGLPFTCKRLVRGTYILPCGVHIPLSDVWSFVDGKASFPCVSGQIYAFCCTSKGGQLMLGEDAWLVTFNEGYNTPRVHSETATAPAGRPALSTFTDLFDAEESKWACTARAKAKFDEGAFIGDKLQRLVAGWSAYEWSCLHIVGTSKIKTCPLPGCALHFVAAVFALPSSDMRGMPRNAAFLSCLVSINSRDDAHVRHSGAIHIPNPPRYVEFRPPENTEFNIAYIYSWRVKPACTNDRGETALQSTLTSESKGEGTGGEDHSDVASTLGGL